MFIKLQLFGGGGGPSGGGSKRNTYLSQMINRKARNAVDQLYRPNATKGDGGTADALRYEARNRDEPNERSHYQKAKERVKNLDRILREESLTDRERDILHKILDDLREAIKEWEKN